MFLVDELAVKVRCLWGYLSGSIEPSLVRFEVRIGQQASVRNACQTYVRLLGSCKGHCNPLLTIWRQSRTTIPCLNVEWNW